MTYFIFNNIALYFQSFEWSKSIHRETIKRSWNFPRNHAFPYFPFEPFEEKRFVAKLKQLERERGINLCDISCCRLAESYNNLFNLCVCIIHVVEDRNERRNDFSSKIHFSLLIYIFAVTLELKTVNR